MSMLSIVHPIASSVVSRWSNGVRPLFAASILELTNKFGVGSYPSAIRNSTGTFKMYDSVAGSILRTAQINEHRVNGCREVVNKLDNPSDLTSASWVATGATKVGMVSGVGPNGEAAMEVSFASSIYDLLNNQLLGASQFAGDSTVKFLVRAVSGTTSVRTRNGAANSGDITIDTSWKWIASTDTGLVTANNARGIQNNTAGNSANIYIIKGQAEDVTGKANQNPSEYVGGTGAGPFRKLFDTTNGNTVTNNVVTEAAGVPLHPKKVIDGAPWYLTRPDWTAGVAYAAGAEVNHAGKWYSTVAGGTDTATFGDTITWVEQGLYTGIGLLDEGSATNQFLQSGTPATQNINLGVGTFVCWIDGTGGDSITTAAGTAVGTGFGAATPGTPNVITITTGGTVSFTVAGTPVRAQVESGNIQTSYIPTTTGPVPRANEMGNIKWDSNFFPQAKGTMALTWMPQFASGELAGATQRNIVDLTNTWTGLLYQHSSGPRVMASYDGTTLAYSTLPTWSRNDAIEMIVDWDDSIPQMSLHYRNASNGDAWTHTAPVAYDGAFTNTGFLQLLKSGGGNNSAFRNIPRVYGTTFTNTELEAKFQ